MNKERVINIIREPLRMENEKDLPLIKELVEEFPYFSAPYVLLTKLLSEQKSIYVDKYLKLSAAYIGNREVLHNIIHSSLATDVPEVEKPIAVQEIAKKNIAGQDKIIEAEEPKTESAHIYHAQKIPGISVEITEDEVFPGEKILESEIKEPEFASTEISSNQLTAKQSETEQENAEIEGISMPGDEDFHITNDEKIPVETIGAEQEQIPAANEKESEFNLSETELESEIESENSRSSEYEIVEEENASTEVETAEEKTIDIASEKLENNEVIVEESDSLPINPVVESAPTTVENIVDGENNAGTESPVVEQINSTQEEKIIVENAERQNENTASAETLQNEQEAAQINEDSEAIAERVLPEVQVAKTKINIALDLPPLAAYDYFAFRDKNKPKTGDAESEILAENTQNVDEIIVEKQQVAETASTLPSQKPLKFADWLQSLKTNNQPEAAAKPIQNTVTENIVADNLEVKENQETVLETLDAAVQEKPFPKPERRPKRNEVEDIISKFIQTEPRIKPKPAKFFTPQDVAERSAEEDNTLATETLANIYLKQGLNDKAVEIFKQLMLKYPQKSNYFAVKINEINTNP